jgi:hypothetical protein
MLPEQENERKTTGIPTDESPLSKRDTSRFKTERSVGSTLCSNDESSTSFNVASASKSFKFRPRFADEGLEDLDSHSECSLDASALETPQPHNQDSDELRSAMKAGVEMVREMEERGVLRE